MPKGGKQPGAGRPAGTPNKATIEFKEALNNLMNVAAPDLVKWLAEIEDPFKRFEVLSKFAEFIHPKQSRAEIQPLGANGKPTDSITKIVIEHVSPKERK